MAPVGYRRHDRRGRGGDTKRAFMRGSRGARRRMVWNPWLAEEPAVSHGDPIGASLLEHFDEDTGQPISRGGGQMPQPLDQP
jgi:hypothetical protein